MKALDIAPVWPGCPVGFALLTDCDDQFVAFYDADRRMTVAHRKLSESAWKMARLPETLGWDSHNAIALTLDDQGLLHLAGNMHAEPLAYYRTTRPRDITTFHRVPTMVGPDEAHVTYPLFLHGPNDALLFTYRTGFSGNGSQIYNMWEPETLAWRRLLDVPLTDGEGERNAYFEAPTLGPDGFYHLVWIWRETPDASTNHDPSYARSRDLIHWEDSAGAPLPLPITLGTSDIVDPVPQNGGAINGNVKIGFDSQRRPIVTYCKYDAAGHTQIYNARREPVGWKVSQASSFDWRWDFGGNGTLVFELHTFPVVLGADGALTQAYTSLSHGSGGWLLDEATLTPLRPLPERAVAPPALSAVELAFPGMEVHWLCGPDDATGTRWALRWETLPENRDQPRLGPLPEPSMLRLYALGAPPSP